MATKGSKSVPSNEKVVEDLTKDLEGSNLNEKSDLENEQFEEGSIECEGADSVSRHHDYIDEEELKVSELSCSEEDKEKLRVESEILRKEGNEMFKLEKYEDAADKYTIALRTCPFSCLKERAVLFANRGAAKVKMGLDESAIEDCTKAIEKDPSYIKALTRRAQLYEKADKLDEALEDYKKILELDPSHKEAYVAVQRLPSQIHERNEKMKTEMLGKLKDLGNMILKPFGLSTNNFNMVQDPSTGGYSVSYKQS